MTAFAAEGYRLRPSGFPVLGGEMAANPANNQGFFATAAFVTGSADSITDNAGNDSTITPPIVPLPTGALTGGAIPDGTYNLVSQPLKLDYQQDTSQLNMIVGYLFDIGIENSRLGVSLNKSYQKKERHVSVDASSYQLAPTAPANLSPGLSALLTGATQQAQKQVDQQISAELAYQNRSVEGFGDTTAAVFYTHNSANGKLKWATDLSIAFPDGEYESDRGPNPGKNYRTTRLGFAATYTLDAPEGSLLSNVTIGNRTAYGWNTENPDGQYKTGQFFSSEVGIEKINGNFAWGVSVAALIQTTDDEVAGVAVEDYRYRSYAAGPFVAMRFPTRHFALNLSAAQSFHERNAPSGDLFSLRLIKSW